MESQKVRDAERHLRQHEARLVQFKAVLDRATEDLKRIEAEEERLLAKGSLEDLAEAAEVRKRHDAARINHDKQVKIVAHAQKQLQRERRNAPSEEEVAKLEKEIEAAIGDVARFGGALIAAAQRGVEATYKATARLGDLSAIPDLRLLLENVAAIKTRLDAFNSSPTVRGGWKWQA